MIKKYERYTKTFMKIQEIEKAAIEVFGKESQKDTFIEESAELTKELLKERRGADNLTDILEEMADVEISLDEMKLIYGSCEEMKQEKLLRLKGQIEALGKGAENEKSK